MAEGKQFPLNRDMAMFERHSSQFHVDLDRGTRTEIQESEPEIVAAVTQIQLDQFRAIERSLMFNQPALPNAFGNQMFFYNPNDFWISRDSETGKRRLEIGNAAFDRIQTENGIPAVKCAGRGKPMQWMCGFLKRYIDHYIEPNFDRLVALVRQEKPMNRTAAAASILTRGIRRMIPPSQQKPGRRRRRNG